jgi:hypothetical protein
MKVWIYELVRENMKIFASEETANAWFAENDPEGVAFAHEVIGPFPQSSTSGRERIRGRREIGPNGNS